METTLVNYLRNEGIIGKERAVKADRICQDLSITGVALRSLTNSLRCQGFPICSGGNGYYIASSDAEVRKTIMQLNKRMNGMQKAIDGLTLNLL